ncbi:MAG: hypothetical protein WBG01_14995 [Bacteroidota bacterium]
MQSKRRVYLSGGMEYATNEGRDWREEMQKWLHKELEWEVFNPNEESDRFLRAHIGGIDFRELKQNDPEKFAEVVTKIVDHDCEEIARRTDILVCYWDDSAARGAGTKGEITIAHFFRKPVYLVTAIPPADIPGWVLGCTSKMFPGFQELKAFLADH